MKPEVFYLRKMKILLSLVLIILACTTAGAQTTILKDWVGENMEYLKLIKKKASYDNRYRTEEYDLRYNDSTLTLIDRYWVFGKFPPGEKEFLKFRISHLTEDTLVIEPLNESAKRITRDRSSQIFTNKEALPRRQFIFQKICFNGWINDSITKIEIDSTGLIYCWGKPNKKNHARLYTTKFSSGEMENFLKLLQDAEIYRIPADDWLTHPPVDYVRFYYNNIVRTYWDISRYQYCKKLMSFFYSFMKNITLREYSGQYKFEKLF